MAKGVMRSTKTRDGIAASLADNVGYLEELYYGLEEDTGDALDAATAASTAAAAAIADVESGLTEMDAILESLSLARASRLNRPNLLKQNYSAGTWAVASGTVVKDVHEIAAEDATAAANAITYTVTDAAITANSVIHAKYSSDYTNVSTSLVSATFAAGVATVTIAARTAHNAAVNITLYICETVNAVLPYGEPSRCYGSSAPWLNSSRSGDYRGDDTGDGMAETVVTLAAADQIEEADGETYTTAIQFAITANTAWGNADWLVYNYGQVYERSYTAGDPEPKFYGDIEELIPGHRYTLSCWARVISGDAAWVSFGYGGKHGNTPIGTETYSQSCGIKSAPVEVTGGTWQRISWTFEFNPTGDRATYTTDSGTTTRVLNWTKRVMFGVHRKYTATLQLCGFRLTEGGLWLPTKYDELSDRLDDEVDTLEGTISGSVATAKAALLAIVAESDTATATASHAVGELFVMGDTLYKCTVAIATGETITPGTNCTATTLEAEIAAAKAYVDTAVAAAEYATKASPVFTGSISMGRTENSTIGNNSTAEGSYVTASGNVSHAEGEITTASGTGAHAEGTASYAEGNYSHAEGTSYAEGAYSHSEGSYVSAIGLNSHAEGVGSRSKAITVDGTRYSKSGAHGNGAHAEGKETFSVGEAAHAEGYNTWAMANYSHTEGQGTIAKKACQHVFGKYNVADITSVEIVGNGSASNSRANIRTLDESGNEWLAGNLTLGNTTLTEANLQALLALLN